MLIRCDFIKMITWMIRLVSVPVAVERVRSDGISQLDYPCLKDAAHARYISFTERPRLGGIDVSLSHRDIVTTF